MHLGNRLQEEVVVLATLGITHHLDDVGNKLDIIRISLVTRSEQSDKVVAAGHLAGDEKTLYVRLGLGDLLGLLGLANKSVSFDPQVYLPEEERQGADPVLKDGNLLTNVFNKIIRTCFYTIQKDFDGKLPLREISESVRAEAKEAILTYEQNMYDHQFHKITYVLDTLIRNMNKYLVNNLRTADANGDTELKAQVLADSFYGIRVATALIHPIAPAGCEKIREYLNVDERIYNWDYIFSTLTDLMPDPANHAFKFLEPRVDFFKMHETQLAAKEQ